MAGSDPNCPMCQASMRTGGIAVNGRNLTWSSVVWEEATEKILSGRTVTLFRPGFLGRHRRRALLCPSCGTVVLPPDPEHPV